MSRDPTIEFYHRESDAQRAEIDSLRAELEASRKDAAFQCERAADKDCAIKSLRAELAANNELYAIAQSDLAAVSLQYDAATAVIERLEAEIASLRAELATAKVERDVALNTFKHEFDRAERAEAAARHAASVENEYRDQNADLRKLVAVADEYRELTDAAARQDAEEKARLKKQLSDIAYANIEGRDYRTTMLWFQAIARAALACRPQQASHDPFRCEACRADGYCSRPEGCLASRPQEKPHGS